MRPSMLCVDGQQRCLPTYRHKVDTVMHHVPNLRSRTARCITKVYPNHLRKFCIASKACRPKCESDEGVTNKCATIVCNFLPMSGTLHESNHSLYSKQKVCTYYSTEINYQIIVCGPRTHRRIHLPKSSQQDETVQAANLFAGHWTT
jgi:hypothetical protein